LFLTVLKAGLAAHGRHHAAHGRRVFRPVHVQFAVTRALPLVAIGTQIIRPLDRDRAESGKQLFGTHLMKPRLPATGTSNDRVELCRHAQKVLQNRGPQLVGGGADGHLDRLQIETAAPAQIAENNFQQRGYFPLRFVVDCFGRFFSSGDNESAIGRARQMLSFTCSSS
jgi:hypothetical protein